MSLVNEFKKWLLVKIWARGEREEERGEGGEGRGERREWRGGFQLHKLTRTFPCERRYEIFGQHVKFPQESTHFHPIPSQ